MPIWTPRFRPKVKVGLYQMRIILIFWKNARGVASTALPTMPRTPFTLFPFLPSPPIPKKLASSTTPDIAPHPCVPAPPSFPFPAQAPRQPGPHGPRRKAPRKPLFSPPSLAIALKRTQEMHMILYIFQQLMHNYIIPNRYVGDAKMGNWYEEKCLKEHHFRDYLKAKDKGQLLSISQQDRLQYSLQPVQEVVMKRQVEKSTDGLLHFGMTILLANKTTKGVLSFNLNEKIIGEDAFAVTTSASPQGPCLRNVFTLQSLTDQKSSNTVSYGQKFRIVATIQSRKLYLQSWPLSPQRGSKISRSQQVSLSEQKTSNTIWLFDNLNPKKRYEMKGGEIHIGEEVLIRHALTAQWLAADLNIYLNEFGEEFEVFAKSMLLANKTQNLAAEKMGHISVEVPLRDQRDQNCWRVVT